MPRISRDRITRVVAEPEPARVIEIRNQLEAEQRLNEDLTNSARDYKWLAFAGWVVAVIEFVILCLSRLFLPY